jgi:hypothetical protein
LFPDDDLPPENLQPASTDSEVEVEIDVTGDLDDDSADSL